MSGNPDAKCPSHMDPCYLQNISKFPCCTEQVGNVERFEEMKKKWDEERAKYQAEMNATKAAKGSKKENETDSDSADADGDDKDKKKDGSWFGW